MKYTCDNCPYRGVATRDGGREITSRIPEPFNNLLRRRDAGEQLGHFALSILLASVKYASGRLVHDEDGNYWRELTALAPVDYDACFFNPVPTECPPQNWCGRHPGERRVG